MAERKFWDTRQAVATLICTISAAVAFVVVYSVFIGTIRHENDSQLMKRSIEKENSVSDKIHKNISQLMSSDNIKNNSRHYSEYPHLSGSKRNEILAREMSKQWQEFGFDRTEISKYRALLSYPEKPSEIHLKEKDTVKKKLVVKNEPAFSDSEKKGDVVYPFNAFAVSGDATGELVYVNYGLDEDYKEIKDLKVNLTNKIFLIRYGTPSPRSKIIFRAKELGAVGVIFFSDPADYTYSGEEYPKGWMLNEYGVQRGSVYELVGDALSLGYPSKEHYFRDNQSAYEQHSQFGIPSQPISGRTAAEIFDFMEGDSTQTPAQFKGNLNVTYSLVSGKGKTITLKVKNKLEDKDTFVVCGSLYGRDEPDRYIILGNHRDAWTYGAADPVSGSAVMTEIVRVLGKFHKKTKYRPRRSIMVCSWSAEEAGLIGSTEWADDHANFISTKVVAYLNVDMAIEGNFTVQIKSMDHMIDAIFEAAKAVEAPGDSGVTLFKDMCHKHALLQNKTDDLDKPDYDSPGAVSDNKHFNQRYGISVSDYRFIYSKLDFPKLVVHNGHYHTLYDSFGWMSKFIDPKFDHHLALGRLWLQHSLILADAILIPFDLNGYAKQIQKSFLEFEKQYESSFKEHKVSLDFAKERIKALISESENFQNSIKKISLTKLEPGKLRAINDRIMHFEKNFILESNVGKQQLKHVIYTAQDNFYGIVYAMSAEPGEDWDNVRKEITLLVWCVDMATRSLNLDELQLSDE